MKTEHGRKLMWWAMGLAFLVLAGRVIWRDLNTAQIASDKVVIRLAVGDGRMATSAAFNALAEDYMAIHPEVIVKINMVPDKTYLQFLRTQLSGGTAPDIMQIAGWLTGMDEMRNQHFIPLTEWVTVPNPYNAGTELATTPWYKTYIDGLTGTDSYSRELRNYFGISTMMSTVRIFYNKKLMQRITGSTKAPESFDELMTVCKQIEHYASEQGQNIVPFAGSRIASLWIMSICFSAVNQQLYLSMTDQKTLELSYWDYPKAYLAGKWDYRSPSLRLGYQLVRDLGRYQRLGFMQLRRGDALLQFAQEEAVMFTTQTKDSASIKSQLAFPIGAFPIPVPSPVDPGYERFALGQISESFINTGQVFGIVKTSRHQPEAVDFLRYMGSQAANEKFARLTDWLPAIIGAKAPLGSETYKPITLGYPGRFWGEMNGRGDARFILSRNLHLLFAHNRGVEAFCQRMDEIYGPAIVPDLVKHAHDVFKNVDRQESAILATWKLSQVDREGETVTDSWREECVERVSAQNNSEVDALQTLYLLWKHPLN